MPSPSTSLATQRPELAGSLVEFDVQGDAEGYIAQRVLPVKDVAQQAGSFGRIKLEELLQHPDTERAPGSNYARGDWTFEKHTWSTTEQGWEEPIDDRERAMYRDYFDAEQMSTLRARGIILRNGETRAANLLFNETNFSPTTVGTPWTTHATATPVDDVEAAVRRVYAASGLWPNALIVSRMVFRDLRLCQQIIDMIKAQNFQDVRPGNANEAHLSAVFDLDQIIVAGGTKNTANPGQSRVIEQIWSTNHAMVAKVATTSDHREPCVGRTFHFTEDDSMPTGTVETYRDETVRGDVVRVRHDVDENLLYKEAADLMNNISA